MGKVLVVQFRVKKDAIKTERDDIVRTIGGYVDLDFVSAVKDDVKWDNPERILSDYHGVILGGSGDMHFDAGGKRGDVAYDLMHETATKIRPFLLYLVENDIPTLGICLGHQLLAHAMGTDVKHQKHQSKTGTFTVKNMCASDDPLFGNIPQEFAAQYGHKDALTCLPKGATLLVAGDKCDFGAVRYGKNVYSTQFHPEMDRDSMVRRIEAHPEYLPDGVSVNDVFAPSPHASKVLVNFAHFVNRCAQNSSCAGMH